MGNFNKDQRGGGDRGGKKFGGKRDFGGRSFGGDRGGDRGGRGGFGGGRDGERPTMHKATCSACGKECEVPFRPTGDKPVFCSDCFRNKGNDNPRNERGGGRDFGGRDSRPRFDDKRSFQNDGAKVSTPNYKEQFDLLNAKMDKILRALAPVISGEATTDETPKAVEVLKTVKFKKAPKKEVEPVALKKALAKAMDKKPIVEKVATKKVASKKPAVKKPVAKKKK